MSRLLQGQQSDWEAVNWVRADRSKHNKTPGANTNNTNTTRIEEDCHCTLLVRLMPPSGPLLSLTPHIAGIYISGQSAYSPVHGNHLISGAGSECGGEQHMLDISLSIPGSVT